MQGGSSPRAGHGNDAQPGDGRPGDGAGTQPGDGRPGDGAQPGDGRPGDGAQSQGFASGDASRAGDSGNDAGAAQSPPSLGSGQRGPGFAPPRPPTEQQSAGPTPGAPGPPPPPGTKLPAVLTAAVIGLVAVVVVIATVGSHHHDADVVDNKPSPSPSALPSTSSHSIVFTSREGSGRLTVLDHHWSRPGAAAGSRLRVRVEIHASRGTISYSPRYFQTFDDSGTVFQARRPIGGTPRLGDGYLHPGDTVRGNIAFDMRRGDTTLVMSNALQESVTALRIAG